MAHHALSKLFYLVNEFIFKLFLCRSLGRNRDYAFQIHRIPKFFSKPLDLYIISILVIIPHIRHDYDRSAGHKGGNILQPKSSLRHHIHIRPAVVDDNQVAATLSQEATMHRIHNLLPTKIPEIDCKRPGFSFCFIRPDLHTGCFFGGIIALCASI